MLSEDASKKNFPRLAHPPIAFQDSTKALRFKIFKHALRNFSSTNRLARSPSLREFRILLLDSWEKKHKLELSAGDADAIKRRRGRLITGSEFNNARLQERTDQRSLNKGNEVMKTIQHTPEEHNLMEVMSESVMATLIIGLSVAATLVAIMMVFGA
jgi:hypothetical protein